MVLLLSLFIMTLMPDQLTIFQLVTNVYYIMTLILLILVLLIGFSFYQNKKAVNILSLLKPIFVKLLQEDTGEIAATMKVSNPLGDLMDMDIPLYRIEKIRREIINNIDHKYKMWLCILVSAAYEDDKGFKDEIIKLMEKDLELSGLHKKAELLVPMCKYVISPFIFFKIILCLLNEKKEHSALASSVKKIKEYINLYNISQNVRTVSRFKAILALNKYIVIAVIGFFIAGLMYYYSNLLPEYALWMLLLIMVIVIGSVSIVIRRIIAQLTKSLICEDIEAGIMADIPDFITPF